MPNAFVSYLKLFRFPLVFTAIADSAAGYLIRSRGQRIDPLILVGLAAASAGLYCFGMAMNDIADRERDKKIAPGRVLPSGRLTLRQATGASVGVLVISAAALVAVTRGSPGVLAVWGGTVLSIVAYDFFLKIPPVMGLVRALNFLLGAASVAPPSPLYGFSALLPTPYVILALVPFVYVTALTFISTLEEGEFRRFVLLSGAYTMATAALLPEFLVPGLLGTSVAYPAWVASGVTIGMIAARSGYAKDRKGLMLLVRDGVGAIILLEAAMIFSAGMQFAGFAVAGLVFPAALLVTWFKKLA